MDSNKKQNNELKSHVISTLVENKPGVLQKVSSLFTRRGFNIESITVGESETKGLAAMVIISKGDEKVLEQITKQLNKLIDVVKVVDLDPNNSVKRELALIKVKTNNEQARSEIIQHANIFRGKIIDMGPSTLTIEITGDPNKINALISLLTNFGIKKIVRTGPTAIARETIL
ncbi:acetolactate synthase small subunit [Methanobrevibacter arboriphilus]|jgi:acetolactate synthase-1/3 small subunit|uniref:Acetolactate synthase small subunit n=1 Tax=Methanobrevibacter arboriphilus TaxID=39441 RepID=A0ACA8R4G5_METAZ|nr:acetolactate synthase small subunit [Methanobrevibacter arboriphilus]MCC7561204.1 acetolactate synthase small subunit [Methanobrevibacter arboriphilus]BBL62137.1 acetolactate synthase small subunit [Methanobrevibacter arboriphilus]GLI11831.1 acetolactate synthase small subunit [Methanobrevibacter arboriphilus]